jgi:hypothetical protein
VVGIGGFAVLPYMYVQQHVAARVSVEGSMPLSIGGHALCHATSIRRGSSRLTGQTSSPVGATTMLFI